MAIPCTTSLWSFMISEQNNELKLNNQNHVLRKTAESWAWTKKKVIKYCEIKVVEWSLDTYIIKVYITNKTAQILYTSERIENLESANYSTKTNSTAKVNALYITISHMTNNSKFVSPFWRSKRYINVSTKTQYASSLFQSNFVVSLFVFYELTLTRKNSVYKTSLSRFCGLHLQIKNVFSEQDTSTATSIQNSGSYVDQKNRFDMSSAVDVFLPE